MADTSNPAATPFNLMIVGQGGRLQYEAMLLLASLRHTNPGFAGQIFVAEPQNNHRWDRDPTISNTAIRAMIEELGGQIIGFENTVFGGGYPYGNKIEGMQVLPEGEPFLFLDTDTLITGDLASVTFDFDRPSASMKREGIWPKIELYGPGYSEIWGALYERFGLDMQPTLDLSQPDEYWQRYLYFNAGFFYYACPKKFGQRYLDYAREIRDDPPEALVCQELRPWLDQIALPLVIHSFGGGRDSHVSQKMDHEITCHYRLFPLLYAREADPVVALLHEVAAPNKLKKLLKEYEPIKRMVYQGRGQKVRDLFDREALPRREQMIRNQIKKAGLWMR
ncbi:MAG: hypothetical protein AAGA12_07775 [Pseudomonadota bacterium]